MEYTVAHDSAGRPFALHGVNVELMRWIDTGLDDHNSIPHKALRVASPYKRNKKHLLNTMLAVLGGGLGHDFQAAEKFMYDHWHAHPEIGPYPCPELLSEYQAAGVFYSGYRDHVVHQLRVYLLGLYIYEKCPDIGDAVLREINVGVCPKGRTDEKEFLLRWLAAGLCHDVGYILENIFVDPSGKAWRAGPSWDDFLKQFNGRVLKVPLAGPFGKLDESGFEQDHNDLANSAGWLPHSIGRSSQLANLPDHGKPGRGKAWDVLDPAAVAMGLPLGGAKCSLKEYFEFTRKTFTDYDQKLPDHGVASALLLLRSWRAYETLMACIGDELAKGTKLDCISQQDFGHIVTKKWPNRLDRNTLYAAARAIAVHNIDKRRYTEGHRPDEWGGAQLSKKYAIHLSDKPGKKGQSLAFLLRLCDVLQDWDRQRFRPLKEGEHLLESKDVSLRCKAGKIHVCYRGDALTPKGERPIWDAVIADLREALDNSDVAKLVVWDKVRGKKTKKFTEVDPDTWRPKSPPGGAKVGARKKSGPSKKELGEIARKIKATIGDGWDPVRVGVAACEIGDLLAEGKDCHVRLQLLHHAADSCRMASALFETVTVLTHVCSINQAVKFLYANADSTEVGVGKLLNVTRGLKNVVSHLHEWFATEIPGRRSYPRKLPSPSLKKRIENFFFTRLQTWVASKKKDARDVADHFVWIYNNLDRLLISWEKLETSKQDQGVRIALRQGPLNARLYFLSEYLPHAIESLRNVVSSRTEKVEKCFQKSVGVGNTDDLGTYMADRLRNLPHNGGESGFPIWKRKEAHQKGGRA